MSCGGEDESIDVVLLVVFYLFLFVEESVGVLDLFDADDVWLSKETFAFGEAIDSALRGYF